MRRRLIAPVLGLATALTLVLGACEDSGPGDALTIEAYGLVGGRLVFDSNGNGEVNNGDEVLLGWTVNLDQPAGGTVASGVTDHEGFVIFEEVPVGQLVPAVPASELGDTLALVPASAEPFTLGAFQVAEILPLLKLPSFTVKQVRELNPGKPVFTEGVVLNTFLQGDVSVHIRSNNGYLRVLSVDEATSFAVGDYVRVRGRTLLVEGVPMLDGKALYKLLPSSGTPQPILLSTGEAAGARGGSLDAALVLVGNAEILEVVDEGDEGVRLTIDDGSGPLSLRFRSAFDVDPDFFDPDTDSFGFAAGLLVPVRIGGELAWEIRPRTSADIRIVRTTE